MPTTPVNGSASGRNVSSTWYFTGATPAGRRRVGGVGGAARSARTISPAISFPLEVRGHRSLLGLARRLAQRDPLDDAREEPRGAAHARELVLEELAVLRERLVVAQRQPRAHQQRAEL